ncbi:oxidoreductase-like protein [Xylogone sp. PMI_703]|nr:oxidoreductase-like protein [Xylogone sp. PMI_703]
MTGTIGNHGRIPVIDISGSAPEEEVAKDLVEAAATYGFVYIKNEGRDIPAEAISNIFELSKAFFNSSLEEKDTCKMSQNNRGWSGMHGETLDSKQRVGDFKEVINFGEFSNGKAQQPLPPTLINHEAELNAFQDYCHNLCLKILTLFGVGLDINPSQGGKTWFASRHSRALGPSGCTLRFLYYPSVDSSVDFDPEVDIRAGAHSDYGSITLLFQNPGQPGLELLPPNKTSATSQDWTPVAVTPPGTENDPLPPILVNIGDLLSSWTNNLLKSTVHRVVFPKEAKIGGEDRYSIAFFCHPVHDAVLDPVPSERVKALSGKGSKSVEGMTAEEHLLSRLRATYLDLYKDQEEEKATA